MSIPSVLWGPVGGSGRVSPDGPEPTFFHDLNLDQIMDRVVAGRDEYNLPPYFRAPLDDIDAITYRQEVFRDLEEAAAHRVVTDFVTQKLVASFTYRSNEMRSNHAGFDRYFRERFFLNAVAQYCEAVAGLGEGLRAAPLRSHGLRDLCEYACTYIESDAFVTLRSEAARLQSGLDDVRYSVWIKGDRITVAPYDEEPDLGSEVEATFVRFRQAGTPTEVRGGGSWENFAATGVLELVAKVYPELFAALDSFCARNLAYLDEGIAAFDREIQFYLAYLDYISPLQAVGLVLSYPSMSAVDKDEQALGTFDLALASQLNARGALVVRNDITLSGAERILVVSGPNNGGKTTLARAFGQLHYLARLGCRVPGGNVQLFLCDQIFTHFEREEDITSLEGKLQEELNRWHADLEKASTASVFVLNEVFNSTTAQDTLFLSRKILEKITALGALACCVTFLDELSVLNDATVSMVATVVPDDPAIRTHHVVRAPADGRAYARAIADKYGLSFARLVEEISR